MTKQKSTKAVYKQDYFAILDHLEKAQKQLRAVKGYRVEASKAYDALQLAMSELDSWYFSLPKE